MKPATAWQAGYTIIETMIFLVISAVLVLGALGLFSGHIQQTQFSQAVQQLDQLVRTTANEASTGTYPTGKVFGCDASSGAPVTSGGTDQQGTRLGCVFAGKIMTPSASCDLTQSVATSKCTSVNIYTVVGRSNVTSSQIPSSLIGSNGAKPRLVLVTPTITDTHDLTYGTEITGIYKKNIVTASNDLQSGLGFFQTFNGSYDPNGNLASGSQNVETWAVKSLTNPLISPLSDSDLESAMVVESLNKVNSGDMVICLKSGSADQKASITVVTTNGAVSTNVVFGDGQCPS